MKKPHLRLKRLKLRITPRDCAMLLIGAVVVLAGFITAMAVKDHRTTLSYDTDAITIPWVPASVKQWQPEIVKQAKKYDISPNLIAIIITMESGGNPKAHSEADAQGLMQVTPLTAKDIAARYLKKPVTSYDLYDPATSIEFGTAYLAVLRDNFGEARQGPSWNETVELIAAGYNGGPGAANAVLKGEGLNDTQTVVYSRDAFNMWRERNAAKSPTFSRWLERGGQSMVDSASINE